MASFCSFSSCWGLCDPRHHRLLLHGRRCRGQKSAAAWNNSPHSCHDHTKCVWAVKVGEWWTVCQTLKEIVSLPHVCSMSVIVKYPWVFASSCSGSRKLLFHILSCYSPIPKYIKSRNLHMYIRIHSLCWMQLLQPQFFSCMTLQAWCI